MRPDPTGASTPSTPQITKVVGGAYGLEASYDSVRALADTFDSAGNELRGWAGLGARTMADPDLVESAVLAPVTFAEAEHAVLAATTGPDGLLVESAGWETDALLVRTTVAALEATDRLVHDAIEVLDQQVGHVVGLTLGASAPVLLPALALGDGLLPAPAREEIGRELEDWVVEHPGVVQHTVNGGGGLLDGLWDGLTPTSPGGPLGIPLLTPDTESAAGLLAMAYGDDGAPRVLALDGPSDSTQPADLTDLIGHLRDVARLSPTADSPLNGTIEIQTLGAGDDVRHIVYLPGTDDLTTLPWTQDGDVRDMATNLLLIGGRDNAYQQGILDAMARAHIGPHDPVLLVGHSQGGMEAAAILSQGSDFNITDVVTAGSPTAQVPGFPDGSHVLSLEHQGDVVPLLDGEDNPDSVEQVTVGFGGDGGGGGDGVVDNHGFGHYLAGAAAVDASADPSILEQLDDLRRHGFLAGPDGGGGHASSQVFQITRDR
jgi:hypothetical protein